MPFRLPNSIIRLPHPSRPSRKVFLTGPDPAFKPLASRFLTTSRQNLSSTPMAAQTDTEAALNASSTDPPITPESLSETLQSKLQATHVDIVDMSGGCGQAFNAVIVSPEFEKKSLLQRHRLVNGALKQEIAAIHAWTPRCLTPEQWEKEKEKEKGISG